jgi:hypothetical protein
VLDPHRPERISLEKNSAAGPKKRSRRHYIGFVEPQVVYHRPANSQSRNSKKETRRQLYRRGRRPLGQPVGPRYHVSDEPRYQKRRPGMALGPAEVRELARLLDQDQDGARGTLLFLRADQAGQVTYSNLYAASEPIVEPTEKEAQDILEMSFRWGHSRNSWIICDQEKNTWTVGTTWKRPYKLWRASADKEVNPPPEDHPNGPTSGARAWAGRRSCPRPGSRVSFGNLRLFKVLAIIMPTKGV